jgi:hypothetical protein
MQHPCSSIKYSIEVARTRDGIFTFLRSSGIEPKSEGLAAAYFAMESQFRLKRARATGVVDTGGKVAIDIKDTSGTSLPNLRCPR